MVFPQALVIQFDGDVGVMLEGLVDEGRQNGMASQGRHVLELMRRGFPPELGEPLDPVGVERREIPRRHARIEKIRDFLERLDHLRRGVRRRLFSEPVHEGTAGLRVWDKQAIEPCHPLLGE
jgi:hypothetical protein